MKPILPSLKFWFLTGSQHLYGAEALREVEANARVIASGLGAEVEAPCEILFKPVLTTAESILTVCREAEAAPDCAGVICWMHTFSPAKMWIGGLLALSKPICHLHTQFNRDIPWAGIDMDFMNLHQSAHGDREFGFLMARMRRRRKVIVGHWQDPEVAQRLRIWMQAASGWHSLQTMKVVRFGDNMRNVAVTEGDKVEAQIRLGVSVNTHGIGDLAEVIAGQSEAAVSDLCAEYAGLYALAPELSSGGQRHEALRSAARIELGMREFLSTGGFSAFTDTFEDLHGMVQLPGLPVQRLMADGYGFGGEGDWKTAALVRAAKVMAGLADAGTSFMEDYTYHFDPAGMRCLGAHMLEICPSIAADRPRCEIHPLSIGGKADPVRLLFTGKAGNAINTSLVDLGNRFR